MGHHDGIELSGRNREIVPVALPKLSRALKEPAFEQNLGRAVFDQVTASRDGVGRAKERNLRAGDRAHLEQPPHILRLLAVAQAVVEASRAP